MSDVKKAGIDCDKRLKERGGTEYEGGWYYFEARENDRGMRSIESFPTYDAARTALFNAGYEFDNAGWRRKLLTWNWHSHALDGYPGWELHGPEEYGRRHPAYARLEHVNKRTPSSDELAAEWDDIAEGDFYQRDYSYDGSVFAGDGDAYGSGWWFETVAERDRFVAWAASKGMKP